MHWGKRYRTWRSTGISWISTFQSLLSITEQEALEDVWEVPNFVT
jgi:hypothetical protein